MQLRELIQGIGVVEVNGSLDREIQSVVYDVRRVTPGALFVAVRTALGDGHEHVEEAVAKGAVAVICHSRRRSHRATSIEVINSRVALAEISRTFYGDPSSKMRVVAVVGDYGQTTIATLLKKLLENSGVQCGLLGSVRHEIGERRLPAGRNLPESSDLQYLLAQMVRAGCDTCVIELRREQFVENALAGIHLSTVVCSNFGSGDQAENQQFARALRNIPNSLKPRLGVVNVDESAGDMITRNGPMEVVLTYGMGERAAIRASHIQFGPKRTAFQLQFGQTTLNIRIPLVGRHNIYSVLAATGAALSLDLDSVTLSEALAQISVLPGNLEEVTHQSPFHAYVDGASTPGLLGQVLDSVREFTSGRIILVMGCSEKTTSRDRFEMGKAAARANLVVLTADNPGREPVAQIASTISQGLDQSPQTRQFFEEDRAQAIMKAISMASPGDAVLITGKGEHTCQEFADTIVPFDDRECARECLERLPIVTRHIHPQPAIMEVAH